MHQPEAEANQRADDDKTLAAASITQGERAGDAAQQVDKGDDKQRGPQQRQRRDQARAGQRVQRPNKQNQRDTGGDDGRELFTRFRRLNEAIAGAAQPIAARPGGDHPNMQQGGDGAQRGADQQCGVIEVWHGKASLSET